MPSRMTAVKARIDRAQAPPSVRARSMPACSSPRMLAEVRRIQNSIQVTTAAASSMVRPSKTCSAGSSSPPMVIHRTRPMPTLTPIAATTPAQMRPK